MKIKQLMYLDKFLEAPEIICAFPADKEITIQDIREDVIKYIKEHYIEEAYMNENEAIEDLLSGSDVLVDYNNACYMWFTIDVNIFSNSPDRHTSAYIRSESVIKYGKEGIHSSRNCLEYVLKNIENDFCIILYEDYSQHSWYINKEDMRFLLKFFQTNEHGLLEKYKKLLKQHNNSINAIISDLESMLESADKITDDNEKEFVIIDWI